MRKILALLFALSPGFVTAAEVNAFDEVNPLASTDCSGTITAGNSPQTVIAGGTSLSTIMLQNIETNEALWFSTSANANAGAPGSFVLPPCQAKAFATSCLIYMTHPAAITAGKLTVVAATTGHRFSCSYW